MKHMQIMTTLCLDTIHPAVWRAQKSQISETIARSIRAGVSHQVTRNMVTSIWKQFHTQRSLQRRTLCTKH